VAPRPDRPVDAPPVACPCGHGDVPAELAGQRPLLERAAAGDREAFARLYDDQVVPVHRYLLAWTADPARAADLTAQVFSSAPRWLPGPGAQVEAGAWLIAMARDALQGPTPTRPRPTGSALDAVPRLAGPQREVVVLRLLCGHTLDHTAHLSGYPRRAVLELQLAGCLAIASPTPPDAAPSPEEFERRLEHQAPDQGAADPALAVATSLRQAAAGFVTGPDAAFARRLRHELVAAAPDPRGTHSARRFRGPRTGRVAARRNWRDRLSTGWEEVSSSPRPWVATVVAVVGIVVVLALQAFGDPGPGRACGGRPCPGPTTVVAAAAGSSVGTPLATVLRPSTTVPAVTGQAPSPTTRPPAVTSPRTTRPATTAPPTTAPPRSTTTTTAPTTTAPTTTLAPTTTTAAPAPT
jgi:hypothetical protein